MDITVVVSLLVLQVKTKMFVAAFLQIDKVAPQIPAKIQNFYEPDPKKFLCQPYAQLRPNLAFLTPF
jgi:hypothetical protein